MRAVVVQTKGRKAVVLTEDGVFVPMKDKNCHVGETLELPTGKVRPKAALFSAAALFAVLLGFGAWSFFSPYLYVSLDVNPSIEYTVNRYNLVLSAEAMNEDAQDILDGLRLRFCSIGTAVSKTVDQIDSQGYFNGDGAASVMLSAAADDEDSAQEAVDELKQNVETQLQQEYEETEVEGVAVGLIRVQEARELGTTPGKLNLVEKLQNSVSDPESVDVNEWLNKPVKEIMKAIKSNRGTKSDDASQTLSDDTDKSTDVTDTPQIDGQEQENGTEQSDAAKVKENGKKYTDESNQSEQTPKKNGNSEKKNK